MVPCGLIVGYRFHVKKGSATLIDTHPRHLACAAIGLVALPVSRSNSLANSSLGGVRVEWKGP